MANRGIRGRRNYLGFKAFLIFLGVVIVLVGAAWLLMPDNVKDVVGDIGAPSPEPKEISSDAKVEIPSGASCMAISKLLYDAGLTATSLVFRSYAERTGIDSQLRAGEYIFAAGIWSLDDISELLLKGSNVSHDIRVTIPEGLTVKDIAQRFADAGLVEVDSFMRYTEEADFDRGYLPPLGTSIKPANRLEGFLAPDTYFVDPSWDEAQIIDMLLNQFDHNWIDEWQERSDELGMSVLEVVTLASIIEKEAAVAVDRPIISGVFYKRLEIDMMLQSCATIQFLLGEPKVPLLNSDLEIDSPYNTYKHIGLPPGPIAAPGQASLQAALYPQESDYLYFRAKTDGSHRFSVTLKEHEKKQPDDQQ